MAFFLLCMTCFSAPARSPDDVLDTARSLVITGDIRQAVRILGDLLHQDPHNDAALYWLAESALAMEQYDKAKTLYSQLLQRTPDHTAARHRRWLAYLAGEKDLSRARHRVRQEIKELLAGCVALSCKYVAYRGYKYLWDRKRRGRSMLQLVPLAVAPGADKEINESLPGELLEELLQARPPLRGQLAKQFLRYFPRRRGIDLASRVYIDDQIATGLKPGELPALLQMYPDNRHIRLYAVRWLLDKQDLAQTEQVLTEHAQLFERQSQQEKNWYVNEAGWRRIAEWEVALQKEFYGRLALNRQQWDAAGRYLATSAAMHLQPWRPLGSLAKVFGDTGRVSQGMDTLRKALEYGETSPKANQVLRDLLRQQGHQAAEANIYYAQREAVTVFRDVTSTSGLRGIKSQRVAWGDWDNDGDADLLLDGPIILRNDNGLFINVTPQLNVNAPVQTSGGAWVDVDNDGWLDLWTYGQRVNRLYLNQSGSRFVNATGEIFPGQRFSGYTEASAWGDANSDGWLDLYTANYEKPGLERGMCTRDQLFINKQGVLRDASTAMRVMTDAPLCGRGVMWSDIDRDGDQDILVANYRVDRNLLWLNQGHQFVESAQAYSLRGRLRNGAYGNSIGFAIADVNGDQLEDIYLSNLSHPRYIDITDGSGLFFGSNMQFVDRHQQWGIAYEESGADPLFADFDNDGRVDLYITSIYSGAWSHLYQNSGTRFRDISWLSNSRVEDAWGAAVADYDKDGDLDLLVARGDGVRLLRNEGPGGHWLQVAVRSPGCNRFGVGARVKAAVGDSVQEKVLAIGRGTGSQDELVAHFGFGRRAPARVQIEVRDLCGGMAKDTVMPDQRVDILTSPPKAQARGESIKITP